MTVKFDSVLGRIRENDFDGTLENATTENTISIDQNGNVGTNVGTDGAIHIENTGNTGIGLGVYTNIGATADAALVSIKVDNASFDQSAVLIENDGVGNSLYVITRGILGAAQRGLYIEQIGNLSVDNVDAAIVYSNTAHTHAGTSMLRLWSDNPAALSRGLWINHDSIGEAILVDSDQPGDTVSAVYIDRDGNSAVKLFSMKLDCDNAGAGGVGGIDFSSFSAGEALLRVVADATDPTAGGGAAVGRIAIDVGGVVKYVAYY